MNSRELNECTPIRILQVLGSMNYGGAQSFIMNIYRNIDRSKVQFDFIVHTHEKCRYDNEINNLEGKIFHCPKYTGKNHFEYVAWWRAFFKEHPEYSVIHGHVRSTAAVFLNVAKKYGLVTISHSHSTSSGKGLKAVVKNIMQYPIRYTADYLFACSREAGDWLFGNKACTGDKFHIVNNSIEVEKFIFDDFIRHEIRQKFNLQERFVVGHIGRFTPEKNHLGLIDIFKAVHDKKENAVLLLIGDGEGRPLIQEKVEKLGLTDSVIFTGVRSDIPELMQAMDIFVFPSLWEGLGIVVIEAQASGLRSIVGNTIPRETFITDLVEALPLKKSPEVWAEKILRHYHNYERKNTIEDIKMNGYNVQENAKWIEDFYLKVANR